MKDPNNTRDTVPRRGSPLWVFITCVIGVGFAGFVATLTGLGRADSYDLLDQPLFWIMASLIVFGELRPIITPGSNVDTGATTSTAFTFAVLMYLGLPVAVFLQAMATIIAGIFERRAVHRIAFNVAQYTLSFGGAAIVLGVFGVRATPSSVWVPTGRDLIALGCAAAAYFLVNHVLVNTAVALHERTPLLRALRTDFAYQVLVHLALLSLAPVVVVAMHRSPALVPLFVLPFIAVYLNASASMRREHQAMHDGLTGLPNRKLLILRTEDALAEIDEDTEKVGLFLLDLDRFKEVNDTLGHPTGDRLLQLVAKRLTQSVRPGDLVARLGGDEFAVLLPSVRGTPAAREVAARLRAALNEPVRLDGMTFDLEASVGIALHPDHAPDFETLLQRADVAMYVAKEARSGVEVYDLAKDRNSAARLSMLGELRRAVDNGELELYFQPKIALADDSLVGMEALLRWRHPDRGLLTPHEFLPIAEQTYLMRSITQHVIDSALSQLAEWTRSGLRVQVAVNVSARDLLDGTLADTIAAGLDARGIAPKSFELEVTERILMTEPAYAADTVDALAKVGVPFSLDDFGTGYSSLVRLKRLPIEEIKIDSSFVGRMVTSPDDQVIVQSIVDLGHALGLRTVAEGVESERVAARLRAMGCDAAQGWHFHEPMSAASATEWLVERAQGAPQPAG
jgi:diguanylate cyclase (GGDEF)-like protein